MIKNIVFDIGNVLVSFHPHKYFLSHFKDVEKTARLCKNVFGHEAWSGYDQGIYEKADLYQIYDKEFPKDSNDIRYILDHWLGLMNVIEESLLYLQKMKEKGYQIYLLSNISKESADYLKQKMPFFDMIHGAVLSYEIKCNKPDFYIYETLLKKYQLKPQETLFFDDRKENIEAAKQLGIHAVEFHNIEQAGKQADEIIERYADKC